MADPKHTRVFVSFTLAAALVLSACGGSSPTAPTTPPVPATPACQANNTAEITFRNGTNLTLNVQWDGSLVSTLGPSQQSQSMTVAAGVQHRDAFIVANTGLTFCAGTPVLAQCS